MRSASRRSPEVDKVEMIGNFEKVGELLRQIKTDCEMISNYNREKYVVRALSLNTEAYFHQKQNHHPEALKCLDLAESIEREQDLGPIDIVRTKLNKSVILSHLGRYMDDYVGMKKR